LALRRLSRQASMVSAPPKATAGLSWLVVVPGSSSRRSGADQVFSEGSYREPQMSLFDQIVQDVGRWRLLSEQHFRLPVFRPVSLELGFVPERVPVDHRYPLITLGIKLHSPFHQERVGAPITIGIVAVKKQLEVLSQLDPLAFEILPSALRIEQDAPQTVRVSPAICVHEVRINTWQLVHRMFGFGRVGLNNSEPC